MFSGIGGFALACEWAGIETAAFCEIDPYCQAVLRKHWPSVPIYPDVRRLRPQDVGPVDLICGGFPCQPYSAAGKRRGKEDDRDLWPAMLGCVRDFRPTWVCAENVAGFAGMGLDSCLADLEVSGYAADAYLVPALAVGADHHRLRLFIVAHSESNGLEREWTNSDAPPPQRMDHERLHARSWRAITDQPRLARVANGIPRRMDRLRAIGNAVVPQQVYPILKAIVGASKKEDAE